MESDEAWLTSTVADGGGQGGAVDGSGGRRLTAMSEEDSVEDLELFGAVADKLFGRTDREVASPQPPTIGRFVVLRRLGAGGMGVVYLAHDPALDRQVAIKRLHPRALSGEGIDAAAERLRREARAMARVSHRNVVNLYEVGAHKGQLYLAMEYVRGATLTSWLSQRARGWREILAVYCDAGEGLSAAHSAGLVHRDFKPDNVLVSAAGDVKVTDFGLVVAAKDRPASAASSASGRVEAGDSLSATLTSTGAWLGTPRYMSPEQFRGDVTDPRSDQFSFCVALYEALYGERPFAGATVDALAKAVVAGRRRPLPRGAATPTWIAPLLARGLATDPGERWPTMAALLARLRDDPRPRRRRRVSLGAAAIAVLGASGSLVAQRLAKRQAAAACERAGAELDDVWSDDARAAFTHAIERSGTRFARSTAARTLPWIDAYVEQWGQARVDACFAAEVDGTWEEALREGSYACLDERRAQLVHLLNTLEASDDASVLVNAVRAASSLPPIEACVDEARLRASSLPPGGVARDELRRVRDLLAHANALISAGLPGEAVALAQTAADAADALAWPPIQAEAGLVYGAVLESQAEYAAAEAAWESSYFTAGAVGEDSLAEAAAANLAWLVGETEKRHAEGLRWVSAAYMSRARAGNDVEDFGLIQLLQYEAAIRDALDERAKSRELLHRALDISTRVQGERHPKTTTILLNIGVQNFDAGDLARATVQYRAAADRFEEVLGPDHPSVALALTNLASALALLDDRDAAIEANERALEILQGALPPDHDSVLFAMTTMAGLLASVRADEAVAMYERAIVAIEAKFGPNHLKLAEPLAKIGSIHAVLGDPAVALPYLARSLAIMRASLPEDHSDLALPLWGEGTAYVELGRYDEAIAVLEPALALSEIEYGPDHVDLIDSLVKLGIAYHEVGRDRDAVASLERAYKIEVASGEAESEHMSVFPLAQALWSSEEERPRALGLARGAYEALPADDEDRAEIGDWLARRGVELSPPRD